MEKIFRSEEVIFKIDEKVIESLKLYRQLDLIDLESGGLLLGRTDIHGNTRVLDITVPNDGDIKSRYGFNRRSEKHNENLLNAKERCMYFKGNWHSHPEDIPYPSKVDIKSWSKTLKQSKPGESKYVFFIIVGISHLKVWYGKINTKNIKEIICVD